MLSYSKGADAFGVDGKRTGSEADRGSRQHGNFKRSLSCTFHGYLSLDSISHPCSCPVCVRRILLCHMHTFTTCMPLVQPRF